MPLTYSACSHSTSIHCAIAHSSELHLIEDWLSVLTNTYAKNPSNGLAKVITHPELPKKETVFLKKLQNYVCDNIDNTDIKTADLAATVNMSERNLSRKVKALTGDTPKKMLLIIRLEQAAKLLKQTTDNITSLSYQVGFSDASHFSRTFKAHFNMTATEYREQL